MAKPANAITITRWQGGQHPTSATITRTMKQDGLRPYQWENAPNYRYAVRSHNYHKVLYVLEGSLEIVLPDSNQRARIRPGDRVDIPAGVRHGTIVGSSGAKCAEAAISTRKARAARSGR